VNILVTTLADVLHEERLAALRADVGRLVALQDDKRAALDAVRAAALPAEDLAPLAETARENLSLMRQLVTCLRGMAGEEPPTYGRSGQLRGPA
jgi:hypothetical protein